MVYWVVGGEYTDTRFETIVPGQALEQHGPFALYQEAHQVWAARAWATVDDCHKRFRVVEGSETGPGTGRALVEGAGPLG
jgi:hypothetical protein